MATVNLSSSDGRFGMSVPADDAELIASMLLLLEVPRQIMVHHIETARPRVCTRATPTWEDARVEIVLAS